MELIFPKYNVRFISIMDNIDSENGDLDMLPFTNLVNELYAKDISRKQKAAVKASGNAGKRTTHTPIYGYKKGSEVETDWVIDEEAAAIVRMIFNMYLNGTGINRIATILHDKQIETPRVYQGNVRAGSYAETDPYFRNGSTVSAILSKQEYCGDTVNFRTENLSFKSKKVRKNAPENQRIFHDTQPAIISKEVFELVQSKLAEKKRDNSSRQEYEIPLFRDVLFCHACKSKMYILRRNSSKGNMNTYVCSKSRWGRNQCTSHSIPEKELTAMVYENFKRLVSLYLMDKTKFRNNCLHTVREADESRYNSAVAENEYIEKRLAEIPKIRVSLYSDNLSGVLSAANILQCEEQSKNVALYKSGELC